MSDSVLPARAVIGRSHPYLAAALAVVVTLSMLSAIAAPALAVAFDPATLPDAYVSGPVYGSVLNDDVTVWVDSELASSATTVDLFIDDSGGPRPVDGGGTEGTLTDLKVPAPWEITVDLDGLVDLDTSSLDGTYWLAIDLDGDGTYDLDARFDLRWTRVNPTVFQAPVTDTADATFEVLAPGTDLAAASSLSVSVSYFDESLAELVDVPVTVGAVTASTVPFSMSAPLANARYDVEVIADSDYFYASFDVEWWLYSVDRVLGDTPGQQLRLLDLHGATGPFDVQLFDSTDTLVEPDPLGTPQPDGDALLIPFTSAIPAGEYWLAVESSSEQLLDRVWFQAHTPTSELTLPTPEQEGSVYVRTDFHDLQANPVTRLRLHLLDGDSNPASLAYDSDTVSSPHFEQRSWDDSVGHEIPALPYGTYRATVTLLDGTEFTADGTSPALAVDHDARLEYVDYPLTTDITFQVTGYGDTDFVTYPPTATLFVWNGTTETQQVATLDNVTAQSATFTLPAGSPWGSYNLDVQYDGATHLWASAWVDIASPPIWLDPWTFLPGDAVSGTVLDVMTDGGWFDGSTTLALKQWVDGSSGYQVVTGGLADDVVVAGDGNSLTVSLGTDLGVGEYVLEATVADGTLSAWFDVSPFVTVDPWTVVAGASAPQSVTLTVEGSPIADVSAPLELFDWFEYADRTDELLAPSSLSINETRDQLTFDVPAGAPAADVEVRVATDAGTARGWLTVGRSQLHLWVPGSTAITGRPSDIYGWVSPGLANVDGLEFGVTAPGSETFLGVFNQGGTWPEIIVANESFEVYGDVTIGSAGTYDFVVRGPDRTLRAPFEVVDPSPCDDLTSRDIRGTGLQDPSFVGAFPGDWTAGRGESLITVDTADAAFAANADGRLAVLGNDAGARQVVQLCQDFEMPDGPTELAFQFERVWDVDAYATIFDLDNPDHMVHYWLDNGTTSWQIVELLRGDEFAPGADLRLTITKEAGAWSSSTDLRIDGPGSVAPKAVFGGGTTTRTTRDEEGNVTTQVPRSGAADLTVSDQPSCAADHTLDDASVTLTLRAAKAGEADFSTTMIDPEPDGVFSATVPGSEIDRTDGGMVGITWNCLPDAGGDPSPQSEDVGEIELFDPSGDVTDASTGTPIVGAEVTLHHVPGWTVETVGNEGGADNNQCETTLTRDGGESGVWTQAAPTEFGVVADRVEGIGFDPLAATQLTDETGRYAWDVSGGCWYVTVSADGYEPLTSPVVGVPPEVLDLDLALTPTSSGSTGGTGGTGGGGGGSTSEPTTEEPTTEEPTQESTDQPGQQPYEVPASIANACGATAEHAGTFSDAGTGVHAAAIDCFGAFGLAEGRSDGTFGGTETVTRAQMSAFLARVLEVAGIAVDPADAPDFDDVAGTFHEESIMAIAAAGITVGRDGSFDPSGNVTRGQMATFLARVWTAITGEELPEGAASFQDAAGVHAPAINALAEAGIATGRADGMFHPEDDVTRAQMATFMMRLVDLLVQRGDLESIASPAA